MLDKRSRMGKMMDTDKAVWMCLFCDSKVISSNKPEFCVRCNDKRDFALVENLIVMK